jgi:hypothetical protein
VAWGVEIVVQSPDSPHEPLQDLVPFQGADRVAARFFDTRKLTITINNLSSVVLRARLPWNRIERAWPLKLATNAPDIEIASLATCVACPLRQGCSVSCRFLV